MEDSKPVYLRSGGRGRGGVIFHQSSEATPPGNQSTNQRSPTHKVGGAMTHQSPQAPPSGNKTNHRSPRHKVCESKEASHTQASSPRSPAHKMGGNNGASHTPELHENAWDNIKNTTNSSKMPATTSAKFDAAAAKHMEAAQTFLQKSSSSNDIMDDSDDDEYDDNSDGEHDKENKNAVNRVSNKSILSKMMSSFNSGTEKDSGEDLGRTQHYIINSMTQSGNICLICIETIKRSDAVWNCTRGCYTLFHIACIQHWIKDGIYQQQSTLSEEHFPNRPPPPWFCPKCRSEYGQEETPKRYTCYCGSVVDPAVDPWLVPHSCGQVCGRPLKPVCGHSCLLLCHPGPCPPCPKTIQRRCHCGKGTPQVRRCGAADWSCGKSCDRKLACGRHQCRQPCHAGDCGLCPEKSKVSCECGTSMAVRPCADAAWHCEKVCGRALLCGHHMCERVCHTPGQCGTCPRSESRACPCGKTKFEDIPCTEDVPTCLETCDKFLDCGSHQCKQRCHTGPCGPCREMTMKVCRCKKRDKLVQCYKEFLCDTKCANWRDCLRHQCKRKCCDGDCPPCSQPCGKPLGCRQHKCASTCHTGPCYPCPLTVTVSCACTRTSTTVPCGAEKFTKPPKCLLACRKLPDCHHATRERHRCHTGSCPQCRQICGKPRGDCPHPCALTCHSAVLTAVKAPGVEGPRVGPWQQRAETKMIVSNLPCPPCPVPVPVTCLGKHETVDVACSEAVPRSCGRPCGRQLSCTNHTCQKPCHIVEGAASEILAGATCDTCEESCSLPRPEGCPHPCTLPCHPATDPGCPPCRQRLRMRCHCQLVTLHIECEVWVHADQSHAARLQSCQGSCPRLMSCGHKCMLICHPGSCSNPERCTESLKVRCPCRRRKTTFLCNEVQAGRGSLICDDTCRAVKEAAEQERRKAEAARMEAEEKRKKEELELFERKHAAAGSNSSTGKTGGKRRRDRRQLVEDEDEGRSVMHRVMVYALGPALVVLLAVFLYYLIAKD